MYKINLICNVIIVVCVCIVNSEISDKRLCGNEDCTAVMGSGITIQLYNAIEPYMLSFKPGKAVKIYSRPAGRRKDLLGVEIDGKRGYVNKIHIKEGGKSPNVVNLIEVDTELAVVKQELSPKPVLSAHEVVEGTTIYKNDHSYNETESLELNNNAAQTEVEITEPITKNYHYDSQLKESVVNNVTPMVTKIFQQERKNQESDKSIIEDINMEDKAGNSSRQHSEETTESIPAPTGSSVDIHESLDASTSVDKITINETPTNIDNPLREPMAQLKLPDTLNKKSSLWDDQHQHTPYQVFYSASMASIQNTKTCRSDKNANPKKILHLPEQSVELQSNFEGSSNEILNVTSEGSYATEDYIVKDIINNDKKILLNNGRSVSAALQSTQTKNIQVEDTIALDKNNKHTTNENEKSRNDRSSDDNTHTTIQSTTSSDSKIDGKNTGTTEQNGMSSSARVDEYSSQTIKQSDGSTHSSNQSESSSNTKLYQESTQITEDHGPKSEKSGEASSHTTVPMEELSIPEKNIIQITEKSEPSSNVRIGEGSTTVPTKMLSIPEEDNTEKSEPSSNARMGEFSSTVPTEMLNITEENITQTTEKVEPSGNARIVEDRTPTVEQSKILSNAILDENRLQTTDQSDGLFEGAIKDWKAHANDKESCIADFHESDCPKDDNLQPTLEEDLNENLFDFSNLKLFSLPYGVLCVLIVTGTTVVVFLWGLTYFDKSRREAELVLKINNLQKQFLIIKKENELLTEKVDDVKKENICKAEIASSEIVENLKIQLQAADGVRSSLEVQIQSLEKELENSTEVGLELNRMLAEFLNSDKGSDTLISNIDQLQKQLIEQQGTINNYTETISSKETENYELRLELEINNSRVNDLQSELNKMALNLLKLEEDKDQLQNNYETDIASLREQLSSSTSKFKSEITKLNDELRALKQSYEVSQKNLEIKTNEFKLLKDNVNQVNSDNNNSDVLKSMFDTTSIKAELLQLRNENRVLNERFQQESNRTNAFEKQAYLAMEDAQHLKAKYDKADQERMESQTKLEILSNYFKEREAQLQKELTKQESMWIEKQGEATSTIERIKYMQEELQNNKAQYESLKQEIVAQEVQMKSQISVLEKKAHENWVAARQAERKLEDAKQEAAQLRNRLTLRERNLNDEKIQNRLISSLEQNGDLSLNDTGPTLPVLFGTREHLTTSPPLPSLPPFLPPPPGVPFMHPPLGGVPLPPPGFLPPPPSMIPGDHRPPPLGRMSSPPLNSRYSPDSRAYSPYSRNSPSPTSDDEYDRPAYRSYSPYNRDDRRDFARPPPVNRNSIRNHRGTHSSGSAHSNESLEKVNRHNSKV